MTDLKLEGLPKGDHPSVDNFAELFINDVPLLDVRAPVEFNQGAFPNSVNISKLLDLPCAHDSGETHIHSCSFSDTKPDKFCARKLPFSILK